MKIFKEVYKLHIKIIMYLNRCDCLFINRCFDCTLVEQSIDVWFKRKKYGIMFLTKIVEKIILHPD